MSGIDQPRVQDESTVEIGPKIRLRQTEIELGNPELALPAIKVGRAFFQSQILFGW